MIMPVFNMGRDINHIYVLIEFNTIYCALGYSKIILRLKIQA